MLAVCALVPAALGAAGAMSSAPASHDEAVVRAVGVGWTGVFRALDVIVAAPLMLVPVGTRALRAGLASALVTGACGAVAFVIARRLAHAARPEATSPRLMSAVAAVAVLSAVLAPVWQVEASAPGGAVVGALIVLVAMALAGAGASARASASAGAGARAVGFVVGMAASYEPLVLLAVMAAVAPWIERAVRMRAIDRRAAIDAVIAFGLGLLPMALGVAVSQRTPEIAVSAARPFASSIGERAGPHAALGAFAMAEIGVLMLVAAGVGAVLVGYVPAARRALASVLGVIAVGIAGMSLGAASGPSHVASVVLAATCALHILASVALVAAVVAVSKLRVPFAEASAALVVVLELVLPVRAADETLTRREARASHASSVWTEVAWGAAPPAAAVLVSDRVTMRRIAASRATGEMRADLLVVPTFALPSRASDRALMAEPKLAALYRDIALGSTPEELSLATLATQRPLLAGFDPRWDRGLARHFVPVGLTTRFEPEPRGSSDRRRGLDAFTPGKERLVRVAVARRDPELAAATATLLRGRAIGMAACGERDVLSRALDDLRPFAPEDAVASTLVRRIVTTKGPIEVKDLAP
ncbi:MAG: hypothetical protein JWO86_2962 [Myxococcaceae bacterium]|nr:hypothetical protein [Myxococcaceae bacterium]